MTSLASQAGLSPCDGYGVFTQRAVGVRTVDWAQIDLEVTGYTKAGAVAWILWSEHKLSDPLTVKQLANEAAALRQRAADIPAKLIAITLQAPSDEVVAYARSEGLELLRWAAIQAASRRVRATMSPLDPAHQTLAEWEACMEHEIEEAPPALTPERLAAFLPGQEAEAAIEHIVGVGFARGVEATGGQSRGWVPRAETYKANPAAGSALSRFDFELFVYVDEGSGGYSDDGPAILICAGTYRDPETGAPQLRAPDILVTAGVVTEEDSDKTGRWVEHFLVLPCSELAALAGDDEQTVVDAQVARFAEVCEQVIAAIDAAYM